MTRRPIGDAVEAEIHRTIRTHGAGEPSGELDFFAVVADNGGRPVIEPKEPAAPARATRRTTRPVRKNAHTHSDGVFAILAHLPEGHCLSRDEIIARFGADANNRPLLSVNAACGCIDGLVKKLEVVEAIEDGAVSHAGNRVFGYRLSANGRRVLAIAGELS